MMTIDQASAEAAKLFCCGGRCPFRPFASLTPSGRRSIGYADGEFRYTMGIGETWEEAVENAKARRQS